MRKPACATATMIEPPQKVFYLATIFDPQLKKERTVSVHAAGFCRTTRDVNLGIDRGDRWGRVNACCMAHAKDQFSQGKAIWYS